MTRRWFDYKGGIFERSDDIPLTTWSWYGQTTHALGTDGAGHLVQALTLCGKRGCPESRHEIPGRGEVDCPECIELMERDS